jgi:hypothetical protein
MNTKYKTNFSFFLLLGCIIFSQTIFYNYLNLEKYYNYLSINTLFL